MRAAAAAARDRARARIPGIQHVVPSTERSELLAVRPRRIGRQGCVIINRSRQDPIYSAAGSSSRDGGLCSRSLISKSSKMELESIIYAR
jgi:hypothetical protein